MTQAQIDLTRRRDLQILQKWGVREFSFFGSVLADDFRPDSDIDVLVTFEYEIRNRPTRHQFPYMVPEQYYSL